MFRTLGLFYPKAFPYLFVSFDKRATCIHLHHFAQTLRRVRMTSSSSCRVSSGGTHGGYILYTQFPRQNVLKPPRSIRYDVYIAWLNRVQANIRLMRPNKLGPVIPYTRRS